MCVSLDDVKILFYGNEETMWRSASLYLLIQRRIHTTHFHVRKSETNLRVDYSEESRNWNKEAVRKMSFPSNFSSACNTLQLPIIKLLKIIDSIVRGIEANECNFLLFQFFSHISSVRSCLISLSRALFRRKLSSTHCALLKFAQINDWVANVLVLESLCSKNKFVWIWK